MNVIEVTGLTLLWTGYTLLNGFSFLVIFFFFILGRAVD